MGSGKRPPRPVAPKKESVATPSEPSNKNEPETLEQSQV
jgi:hypothetical protein